jgi:hypothetical protein
MKDYWLTQYLLKMTGIGFLLLCLLAIALAFWLPKTRKGKGIALAVVLVVMAVPLAQMYERAQVRKAAAAERQQRYEVAKAHFDERCKTAGEKIFRQVTDVDRVFLIRPRTEPINYREQYKLDDPYGYAGTGEGYIKLFLRGRPTVPVKVGDPVDPKNVVSYQFVEVPNPAGNGVIQYTTSMPSHESERITRNGGGVVPLEKVTRPARTARYGIAWADISTHEDRTHWIAGSSQKIVDLERDEVIAERIGFMFDAHLGDTSGSRAPWSAARSNACPPLDEKVFYFFDRVLQPSRELKK